MRRITSNQWVVGIITGVMASGVFSVICSIIVYIRQRVNFLEAMAIVWSTTCIFINQIIMFPVPAWVIVLGGIILKVFSTMLKKQNENEVTTGDFRKYIKDTWKKWTFTWEYRLGSKGKYYINKDSFRPVCECGCEFRERSNKYEKGFVASSTRGYLYCPICETYIDCPTNEEMGDAFTVIEHRLVSGDFIKIQN